jgi:GDP-4-dehydro-6-deoxy-D-mannose reductase
MNVLITGVSGFLGRRLARYLVDRGHNVSGTYIGERPQLPGVELHSADLLEADSLARAVEAAQPEAVVHLAGLSHVGESWKRMAEYFQVNLLGTERLLAAVGDCRVLLASSAEVYGGVPEADQPIAEDRPLAPESPYALTKAAAERLVVAREGVAVRLFNAVGPGQAQHFALPSFAAQLAAAKRGVRPGVLKVGNLSARRDFLHVDDAVRGYELLLERGVGGSAYNLAGGQACSMAEALERLVKISGCKVRIEEDPERRRPQDIPLLWADTRRLASLGWCSEKSLDGALEDLWRETLASAEAAGECAG